MSGDNGFDKKRVLITDLVHDAADSRIHISTKCLILF